MRTEGGEEGEGEEVYVEGGGGDAEDGGKKSYRFNIILYIYAGVNILCILLTNDCLGICRYGCRRVNGDASKLSYGG